MFVPNLIERVNLLRLYPDKTGVPVMTLCPQHGDSPRHPNLAVYPNNTHCFAGQCKFSEGALDHIRRVTGARTNAELFTVVNRLLEDRPISVKEAPLPPLNERLPGYFASILQANTDQRRHLYSRYGLRRETVKAALIGHTNDDAYSLPVYDQHGKLVTVRFRRDDNITQEGKKYWALARRGATTLYLPPTMRGNGTLADIVSAAYHKPTTLLTEGEFDALALCQADVPAVSFTNGAKAVLENSQHLLDLFRGLTVWVAYDQDEAGQVAGRELVSILEEKGITAGLVRWDPSLGKDAAALVARGMGKNDFRTAFAFLKGGKTHGC